jgi:catechol 2,3-dioxygenase-like lactoylglutathione lyase family enzyme
MAKRWYARPLVFVSDAEAAAAFYTGKLGFKESWRYAEDGQTLIIQVARNGCELILTQQWPDATGTAVIFVVLDPDPFVEAMAAFAAAGVDVADGHWGYPLKIVIDPDGNQLWFPMPEAPP